MAKIKTNYIKLFIAIAISVLAMFVVCSFANVEAEAKTVVIKSPGALKNINWKNKGYGPGNTYVIGNDMTLGDGEYATCRLTKGNFVIDFNGHTVQNANHALTVFTVSGANVTFKDSKVKSDKLSVRSYGAGCIDVTAGKAVIQNGNYYGLSDGTNNPGSIGVGGGTCVINGGRFYGDVIGVNCSKGATLYINGGTFQGGFLFAVCDFGGGKIKISKGTFYAPNTSNRPFALGAYRQNMSDSYNFKSWLAKGSSFSQSFTTVYWNGQSNADYYPSTLLPYAASYASTVSVKSTVKKPAGTRISSVTAGKKSLRIKWKKQAKNTSGYQIQLATNSKFTKGKKTIRVKGGKNTARTVKSLKAKKKYYVRVRTYRNFNGKVLYSKWSKAKAKTTK